MTPPPDFGGVPIQHTFPSATTISSKRKSPPLGLHVNPIYVESQRGEYRVVSLNHGRKWMHTDSTTIFGDVSEAPPQMAWHQKSLFGDTIGPGN